MDFCALFLGETGVLCKQKKKAAPKQAAFLFLLQLCSLYFEADAKLTKGKKGRCSAEFPCATVRLYLHLHRAGGYVSHLQAWHLSNRPFGKKTRCHRCVTLANIGCADARADNRAPRLWGFSKCARYEKHPSRLISSVGRRCFSQSSKSRKAHLVS